MSTHRDYPAETGCDRGPGGQFARGNAIGRTGGRPAKLDFRAVVERKARETGVDLADELWQILVAQTELAKGGSTRAAAFVFDLLTEQDPKRLELLAPPDAPSAESNARQLASIFGMACHGDPPLAAMLVKLILQGVGDAHLDEFADTLADKLSAMPVSSHARRRIAASIP